MKKKKKFKIVKISLLIIISLIVIVLGGIFIFKEQLASTALGKVKSKMLEDYGANFEYSGLKISGLADISFEKLEISAQNEMILSSEDFFISPNLFQILFGDLKISELELKSIEINLNNLKLLKRKKKNDEVIKTGLFRKVSNYSRLLEMVINGLPENVKLDNAILFYSDSVDVVQGKLERFKIKDSKANGVITLIVNGQKSNWNIGGELIDGFVNSKFLLSAPEVQFVKIDKIQKKLKTIFGFKKIEFGIQEFQTSEEEINIKFYGGANELHIINEKVSKDTVIIHNMAGSIDFMADKNQLMLKPSSEFKLNQIKANIGITYHYQDSTYFLVESNIKSTKAQDFLNSLPIATFDKIKTMKMSGNLRYKMRFYLNYPKMDSVYLDSDLEGEQLKILDEGDAQLSKINSEFEYQPFNSKRNFKVGPSNSRYTPLNEISKNLPDAIMESEDGDFYNSNGFNEPAFGKSIIENLKSGSFKRGGSTISMQLVKNVFLSHKKTIDRKLEEMIINWLIQNQKIVSKRRQLEVYLNLIEWGPGVYGVGEASNYYFGKHPSEITLDEALFMAMIIPRPKAFRYYFDNTGHLREYVRGYYKKISYLMAYRGSISYSERDSLLYDVQVTGRAKNEIKIQPDSLQVDSIMVNPAENFKDLYQEEE